MKVSIFIIKLSRRRKMADDESAGMTQYLILLSFSELLEKGIERKEMSE